MYWLLCDNYFSGVDTFEKCTGYGSAILLISFVVCRLASLWQSFSLAMNSV